MADSDNNTTLPFVTRRNVLAGTAITMGAWGSGASVVRETADNSSSDPVVTLWHQWRDARRLTERLCRQQQGLEQQLVETVGFPFVTIQLSDGRRVAAYSRETIDDAYRLSLDESPARAKAETALAAYQLRWDIADREIGYSATIKAEQQAGDFAESLLDAMAATSAASLAGIAAKLDAVLYKGNIWEDGSEFPWPHIRSVLADIKRLEEYAAKGSSI